MVGCLESHGGLLTKQAMRKKLLYTGNMYILKLLLSVVTTRIKALVMSGNKIMYACELSHVLTPSISPLLLKDSDPNQFFR
jgi:hypothetical protein